MAKESMSPKQKPSKQAESDVCIPPPEAKRADGSVLAGDSARKAVAWVNSLNWWQYLLVCALIFVALSMVTGGLDQGGLHPYLRTP
jgi:hypothetical protein